jgi:putative tryptophan/tyrosine transport system substrate-binding protein
MKRRRALAVVGGAATAWPLAARAQKVPKIGFLAAGDLEPGWTQFRKAMADLGYVDGRNIKFEHRSSDADRSRLDALAAALVALEVDVIVAVLSPAVAAAKRATSKIPIIFTGGAPDTGSVTNVARPEANLTGAYGATSVIAGRTVQLFQDFNPATKALGLLLNAPDPFRVPLQREIEAAGRAINIEIVPAMVKTPGDLAAEYDTLVRRGVDGVLVQPSLSLTTAAALALQHRLPAASFRREFVEVGGLMSYGADQAEIFRLVASYVDKVLKGARPAGLPIQQPTRFELILNQKTAKALGLVFTPLFLARADEVIE